MNKLDDSIDKAQVTTSLWICLIPGTHTHVEGKIGPTGSEIEMTSYYTHVETGINYFTIFILRDLKVSGIMSSFGFATFQANTIFFAYFLCERNILSSICLI